ncbi:hypothetical protein CRUP_010138 [Coryphaenoides rupestris]|nr:hypothetical protein CRUP_010138 [Coryphaenoides rupestris]
MKANAVTHALPKLPLPALQDTLALYLSSVRPLLTEQQYRDTQDIVTQRSLPPDYARGQLAGTPFRTVTTGLLHSGHQSDTLVAQRTISSCLLSQGTSTLEVGSS